MKCPTLLLIASLSLAFSSNFAHAKQASELARNSGCFSCHSEQEKGVGPSFTAIAQKYAGQADAVAELTQSIQNGSRGKWGRIPMPGHTSLNAEELRALSEWVLRFKP
jgi:Cytochrome c551/c552